MKNEVKGVGLSMREYRAGDLDAMYALDVLCFEPPFRFSRGAMRRFAEAKKARVVIADEGDHVVGFVIVHVEGARASRVGYVVTLDVEPAMRRRGIAASLMREAERRAAAEGCVGMVLHVFTGNETAVHFYERAGYVRSQREEGFYGLGRDAWVYAKPLNRGEE